MKKNILTFVPLLLLSGCSNNDIFSYELIEDIDAYAISFNYDFYQQNKHIEILEIPEFYKDKKIESIGNFYLLKNLKSVGMSDSITSIGNSAFFDCTNLESVVFSRELISISMMAFNNCVKLDNVDLPDKVTELGDGSFYNCINLNTIILPASIEKIGYNSFLHTSLDNTYYEGTKEMWDSVLVDSGNSELISTIHYFSESEPTDNTASYWHFDENGSRVLW